MKYLDLAIDRAVQLGAEYADIRIHKTTTEVLYLQNKSIKNANNDVLYGYGIRVLKDGTWGFAHSSVFTEDALLKT
ncbi:MAG TPA: DNA gyrase modulator, partial [Candidatus Cloacimonadota bacterium]|nr:DNA gyrase modulator [Candidatus Cloacimonadota bacterium]